MLLSDSSSLSILCCGSLGSHRSAPPGLDGEGGKTNREESAEI
jgi:hypothetical protein